MVRIRLAVLVAAGALVVTTLVLTRDTGYDAEPGRAELSQSTGVTLVGRGFGHGRGMSQWGAQGAAVEYGRSYRQILDFYYEGTGTGQRKSRIRVLISDVSQPALRIKHRSNLRARAVRSGDRWTLDVPGAEQWRLRTREGGAVTRIAVRVDGRWRKFRDVPGAAEFLAGGRPMELRVSGTWRGYRGKLRLARPASDRDVVNIIGMERYLWGVVPREVPASWHPEALKAQAVAARTYAHYERNHPRGRHFDVYDTVASQVYGGADAEHPATTRAVRQTAREVRLYGGNPAFTQYSASNGGWTVQGSVPYQQAKNDPGWDRWSGNPYKRWEITLSAGAFERTYPQIGSFQRLRIMERDGNGAWDGRALRIRIVGSDGRVDVDGTTFRSQFGLRSNWIRVVE